jgi:hypothetical protein
MTDDVLPELAHVSATVPLSFSTQSLTYQIGTSGRLIIYKPHSTRRVNTGKPHASHIFPAKASRRHL